MQIAILGYGTVGSGVLEVIQTNQHLLRERVGEEVGVKYILDRKDMKGSPVESLMTQNFQQIVEDEEISLVVEVLGGTNPAYDFVKQALEAKKHVVTSNKELVEKYGATLQALAKKVGRQFLFEASVGGGIPIIRNLYACLTGDEILEISGILNGTTNYMLTKMLYEGADYASVLKEAQEKGYAESNPEADVEGYDSCRKIAILTSLVSGKQVKYETISCQGITQVSVEDMEYAKEIGGSMKLLATMKKDGEGYQNLVAPFLLKGSHPLSRVNDVFNSVFVKGNMLGDAMFFGSGAGKLPTASAVVADVVEVAKHPQTRDFPSWSEECLETKDGKGASYKFFLRYKGEVESLVPLFGEGEKIQLPNKEEVGYLTEELLEQEFLKTVSEHSAKILSWYRVLE